MIAKKIRVGPNHCPVPHLAVMLASICLSEENGKPVCILLPATQGLAELTSVLVALEWLARDFHELSCQCASNVFVPGHNVRTISEPHYVYKVGLQTTQQGTDGFWLDCLDKRNRITNGRFFVPINRAHLYERTRRKRPIGPPRAESHKPPTTLYDRLARVETYGNSCLIRNRVVLLASRTDFREFVETVVLSPANSDQSGAGPRLHHGLCWGFIHEDGSAVVDQPEGCLGQPLIAVNGDPIPLRKYLLTEAAWTHAIITSRIATVVSHLDLVERISERHRILLIGEGHKRDEVAHLKERGWIVWEPAANEIISTSTPSTPTGITGLDLSNFAATYESQRQLGSVQVSCPFLSAAHKHLRALSDSVPLEAQEDDIAQSVLQDCRRAFFSAADWFEFPDKEGFDAYRRSLDGLLVHQRHLSHVWGIRACDCLAQLAEDLGRFATQASFAPTPKGRTIIQLANEGAEPGPNYGPVFATGHMRSRESLIRMLARHQIHMECHTPSDIPRTGLPRRVIVTSALDRKSFHKLVDPWPVVRPSTSLARPMADISDMFIVPTRQECGERSHLLAHCFDPRLQVAQRNIERRQLLESSWSRSLVSTI